MVKAGLKVGDIFEDDGLRYKVLSVNEDGTYISTRNFEETKAAVNVEQETKAAVNVEQETKAAVNVEQETKAAVKKPVAKAAQKARTRK